MLKAMPTENHLSRIYYELAKIGASSAGAKKGWPYDPKTKEELIALASDMSRFDPRLFDILVAYFIEHWRDMNPLLLRAEYCRMKCPQTVAVICEFVSEALKGDEPAFFIRYLVMGLSPVPVQFYFHDLYSPGGKMALRAAEEGLYEFKKWGFLACERPTVKQEGKLTIGTLDIAARRNILKRILNEKGEINIKDYLRAVHNSVSRQQALHDITSSGLAKITGRGRAARWKLAA